MKEVKNRPNWGNIRQKGMGIYILMYWILGWSIPVAIISTVVGELYEYGMRLSFNTFFSRLLTIAILTPIAGVFIGLISWRSQEKIWSKRNNQKDL